MEGGHVRGRAHGRGACEGGGHMEGGHVRGEGTWKGGM